MPVLLMSTPVSEVRINSYKSFYYGTMHLLHIEYRKTVKGIELVIRFIQPQTSTVGPLSCFLGSAQRMISFAVYKNSEAYTDLRSTTNAIFDICPRFAP